MVQPVETVPQKTASKESTAQAPGTARACAVRGSEGESLHCALLLDKVLPKESPGTPLPNAPKFRSPKLP